MSFAQTRGGTASSGQEVRCPSWASPPGGGDPLPDPPQRGGGWAALDVLVLAFLVGYTLLTVLALADAGRPVLAALAVLGAIAAAMAASRRLLAEGLVFLGAAALLFGYPCYLYPSILFSFLAAVTALALFWRNRAAAAAMPPRSGGAGLLAVLLAGVVALALGSQLLLPLGEIGRQLQAVGVVSLFRTMLYSPADAPLYSLACALRLALFAVLARELARTDLPGRFWLLGQGLAAGLLTAMGFGLIEHFRGGHYILHYRFTSLYANPGWFAEYAAVAAPFLLLPLKARRLGPRGLAGAGLLLASGVMALTLARGGWLAFAVTVAVAGWLYFRPNPFVRFGDRRGGVPALVAAGLLLIAVAVWASGKELAAFSRPINALLAQRVGSFTETPRPKLFLSGLLIAAERPAFGMGYESYARHYPVLLDTPAASLGRFGDKQAEVFETSHNLYIQMISGLGLAGLALWLAMAVRAGWTLWAHARQAGSLLSLAALASLAAFHVYAFFQEMVYVPAVFCLLFLVLAYALALERERGGMTVRDKAAAATVFLLVAAGTVSYALDAGLAGTARRLQLAAYAPPTAAFTYQGFYGVEPVDGRPMRWSAGDGVILAPGGDVALELATAVPDAAKRPVEVLVYANGALLDRVGLRRGERAVRRYALPWPPAGGRNVLWMVPSRSVLPWTALGAPDPRLLGVAVRAWTGAE